MVFILQVQNILLLPFNAAVLSPTWPGAHCGAAHIPACRGQKLEVKPVKGGPAPDAASCLPGASVKIPHE